MITELSLVNFKSFKKLEGMKLNNLTVIAGKNSCGKSSILQSLLLLKQTLMNTSSNQLELEGEYLIYSNLKEISYSMPSINRANIGFSFGVKSEKNQGMVEFSFQNKKKFDHYIPELKTFKVKPVNGKLLNIMKVKISKTTMGRIFPKSMLNDLEDPVLAEPVLKNFMPIALKIKSEVDGSKKINGILGRNIPLEFFYHSQTDLIDQLAIDILNIRYLGPLRANPKRAYVHFSEIARELLPSGENAAHILWARQNDSVRFKDKEWKLKDALNECIRIMGLSQKITPSRVGDLIYKINLSHKNCEADVTISDVGFGYSQVIPIILMCLLSSPGDIILLEQPEIHLHPSSAANLADLFLLFSNDGRRLIIETHSAELISRLRLRVIEDSSKKDSINIVFVEGDDSEKNEGAKVRQFQIDENGMFPEYPDGFLDESTKLADAIINARLNKSTDNIKAPWEC